MKTSGAIAEHKVAQYFRRRGYSIEAINWRRRRAEIDLVVSDHESLLFVEVKYRQNSLYGSGFDYITPAKLQQVQYSAELYLQENPTSLQPRLAFAAVSSDYYHIKIVAEHFID